MTITGTINVNRQKCAWSSDSVIEVSSDENITVTGTVKVNRQKHAQSSISVIEVSSDDSDEDMEVASKNHSCFMT